MDTSLFVIDADSERRAEVCRVLLDGKVHAEPFESEAEFRAFAPEGGLALVHDEDGTAQSLCDPTQDNPALPPVIGYASQPALARVVAAMQAGAVSYLAWPFTLADFDDEMDRIAPAIRLRIAHGRRRAEARSRMSGLTAREREVLVSLITLGTNKAIANHLEISPRTVEKYRAGILVRLGVSNTAQAIRVAVEGGAFDEAPPEPDSRRVQDDVLIR